MTSILVIFRSHTTGNFHGGTPRVTDSLGGKPELAIRSLRSLVRSLGELHRAGNGAITLVIVDDHSDEASVARMRRLLAQCPFEARFAPLAGRGNEASLREAFKIAHESSAELCYFVEDDYLHELSALTEMLESYEIFSRNMGRTEVGIYPVDYPDRYAGGEIPPARIVLGGRRHWRTIFHTTCTFLIPRAVLAAHWEKFLLLTTNGVQEEESINEVWKNYATMFSPIPTLAYHMHGENLLPPFSNWRALWDSLDDLPERAQAAFEARRFDEALETLREIGRSGGLSPALRAYEAQCLYFLSRAPEAIEIQRELLARDPSDGHLAAQLALSLRAIGAFDESDAFLARVPEEVPGRAFLAGWHAIRRGDFVRGMRIREKELSIYRADQFYPLPREKRLSAGDSIRGKKILLALEGGNGDEIAYVRFAKFLDERGARAIIGASREMAPLLSRVFGPGAVRDLAAIPPHEYDAYLPAMSAIPLFKIADPSAGVSFPYLFPEKKWTDALHPAIAHSAAGKRKIGLQWRGNAQFDYSEFKTFPAPLLARFADLGKLFSLQVADGVGENVLPPSVDAFEIQQGTPSWEKTLAAIAEMDFVIAGDTTVAHLAGALGKKTALLLPHAPHPYWADLKERATWYPSIRVFRQPRYNDWEGAVAQAFSWIAGLQK